MSCLACIYRSIYAYIYFVLCAHSMNRHFSSVWCVHSLLWVLIFIQFAFALPRNRSFTLCVSTHILLVSVMLFVYIMCTIFFPLSSRDAIKRATNKQKLSTNFSSSFFSISDFFSLAYCLFIQFIFSLLLFILRSVRERKKNTTAANSKKTHTIQCVHHGDFPSSIGIVITKIVYFLFVCMFQSGERKMLFLIFIQFFFKFKYLFFLPYSRARIKQMCWCIWFL